MTPPGAAAPDPADPDPADPATADPADPVPDSVVDGAVAAAAAAASAARTVVRSVRELAEMEQVQALYRHIWRPGPGHPLMTVELLRALVHAGNYVAGGFRGGALVGACVGFFCAPGSGTLHSHIAGVSAPMRGANTGFALKLHQRAWALRHGLSRIEWTFDPLVRRNAYFNVHKLGARPEEYLPNFYGRMDDGVNAGEDSDRLLVGWPLADGRVVRACDGRRDDLDRAALAAAGAAVALDADGSGAPVPGRADGDRLLVGVPGDVERLRAVDPAVARAWRCAVREVLQGLLADGGVVTGFTREGYYVVERRTP